MVFSETLNRYMERLGCTAQKLSEISGISMTSISRYRNGISSPNEVMLWQLSEAIADLAVKKQETDITTDAVFDDLSAAINARIDNFDYELLSARLNLLIRELGINMSDLSACCNMDKSAFSRVCSGQRRPRNPKWIAKMTAYFVAHTYPGLSDTRKVLELIGKKDVHFQNNNDYQDQLFLWLFGKEKEGRKAVADILRDIDVFDFDEHLRSHSFGKVELHTSPFQLPATKTYNAADGMEQGLLDFLKATITSRTCRDVIFYSDHLMDHCAGDTAFLQKIMRSIAALFLKGIHINIIHNIDRPFRELLLGLEAWIPLYMTGHISAYYFDNTQDNLFHHLLLVSGNAAIIGDCVPGCPESGHYTLYKANAEVLRCRSRADLLLSRAHKLLEIYGKDRAEEFKKLLYKELDSHADCKRLLTAPPIYTISDALLERILSHNGIAHSDADHVRGYVKRARKRISRILQNSRMEENIALWTCDEFKKHPVALELTYLLDKIDVYYSYDEYLEHIREAEAFAARHQNHEVTVGRKPDFRNIQITIRKGEYAVISKNKSPSLHLVVRHLKMVEAIDSIAEIAKTKQE